MTRGEAAYKRHCEINPTYKNGKLRRRWEQLSETVKKAWEDFPYPSKR